jgi:hypothetical protein
MAFSSNLTLLLQDDSILIAQNAMNGMDEESSCAQRIKRTKM